MAFGDGLGRKDVTARHGCAKLIGYKVTTLNRMGRACDHVAVVTM
jgi:hypothetical protein